MGLEKTFQAIGKTLESAKSDIENKIQGVNNLLREKHIKMLPDSPDNEFYRIEYTGESENMEFSGTAQGETYEGAYNQTELACPGVDIEVTRVHVRFTYELTRRQNRALTKQKSKIKKKKESKTSPAAPMLEKKVSLYDNLNLL